MILWHLTRCGNFSKRLMCLLSTSGNYTQVEILIPGTVEKNSSTIRSSGRNRTYACAMPVHSSDHYATEVADRSKRK